MNDTDEKMLSQPVPMSKTPHVHGPHCNHGHHHEQTPYIRTTSKIGPNEDCPCGSGKKYKKCCRK